MPDKISTPFLVLSVGLQMISFASGIPPAVKIAFAIGGIAVSLWALGTIVQVRDEGFFNRYRFYWRAHGIDWIKFARQRTTEAPKAWCPKCKSAIHAAPDRETICTGRRRHNFGEYQDFDDLKEEMRTKQDVSWDTKENWSWSPTKKESFMVALLVVASGSIAMTLNRKVPVNPFTGAEARWDEEHAAWERKTKDDIRSCVTCFCPYSHYPVPDTGALSLVDNNACYEFCCTPKAKEQYRKAVGMSRKERDNLRVLDP